MKHKLMQLVEFECRISNKWINLWILNYSNYLNCGINFMGVDKILRKIISTRYNVKLNWILSKNLHLRFNSPGASSHGGIWGGAVKSMKNCRDLFLDIWRVLNFTLSSIPKFKANNFYFRGSQLEICRIFSIYSVFSLFGHTTKYSAKPTVQQNASKYSTKPNT